MVKHKSLVYPIVANKNFYLLTYGCQMNDYDSRVIASILSNNGYKEVNKIDKADIIILNTCSVREHAEQRALGRINELQKFRNRNPTLLIGIVGCMAQNLGASIKGVDFIVGPGNYRKLPSILNGSRTLYGCVAKGISVEENLEVYSDVLPTPANGVTAFVPVMYGCNNFCSYCIVPYVRGKARSRPYQDILKQIELLVAKGVKEITLLGQSVNEYQYNGEVRPRVDFAQLLSLIDKLAELKTRGKHKSSPYPGVSVWIKFMTSHPKNMTDELIYAMKEFQSVCEWLHLPMQAGSNKILKLMNRKYTKEEYVDWIYKIRAAIPGVSITTDIIVGFPGEEETDFQQTLDLVKTIRFDFAYMFKYSERPKTIAYRMEPKVTDEVKGERLTELINVQNKITYERNNELVGTIQQVLVLGKDKCGNLWQGKTRQNKVVVFDGNPSIGEFVKVKITALHGWTPYGKSEL